MSSALGKRVLLTPLCLLSLWLSGPAFPAGPGTPLGNSASVPALSGEMTADAGLIDGAVQSDAVHLYTLKNSTSGPLKVLGMRGTCGCEHMAIYQDGHEQTSITLQPGQEFQALLGVRVAGQPAGMLSKTAWVYGGPSGIETLASLTLTFRVRQAALFDPPRFEFGDIPAGGSATATVTLHVDRPAASKEIVVPDLVGDTPSLTAVKIGNPQPEVRDGKPGAAITYRITLKPSSLLGLFSATFRTSWPVSAGPQPTVLALPVAFRVVGNLAVVPRALNFGFVAKGATPTRSIMVIGQSVDSLKSATVSTPSAWLKVQGMSNCQPYRSGASGTVTVTLDGPPSGKLQSNISVRGVDGETVDLPVSGFVGN